MAKNTAVDRIADSQKKLADYKNKLKGKSLVELQKMETECIKKIDDLNKKVSNTKFNLPKDGYVNVAKSVQYFVNKETCDWRFVVAYQTLYDFWNPEKYQDKIPYATLDITLRTLGKQHYTGIDEWRKVIEMNDYFKSLSEAYYKLTSKIYDLASEHSALIDALNINDPDKANNKPVPTSGTNV